MSRGRDWWFERNIAALQAHRDRRAQFRHAVQIHIPKTQGSKEEQERNRDVLDTLYQIAPPVKGKSPQQDKWMITDRRTASTTYRAFTVRFRDVRDATYFKLKCGGK